jgi:hypothetical protein
MWVHSNRMGWGDDTSLNLSVVQNGNGLRMLTTQESHTFKRVECQITYVHRRHLASFTNQTSKVLFS